jgi:hypothetical protein
MAAIGETENTFVEFESDVNVDAGVFLIGDFKHFFGVGEPEKLAIELEMQSDDATRESKPEIFSLSLNGLDSLTFGESSELRRTLRFSGDGVQDVNAANLSSYDEGAESLRDGFYFREFGHVGWNSIGITRMALV